MWVLISNRIKPRANGYTTASLEHKSALGEEILTFLADTEFPISIYAFLQGIATRFPDGEMMSTEVVLTKDSCEKAVKNMHKLNAYWLVKCDDVYVSEW